MSRKAPCEFPNPFDRIQVRTVWREKFKPKPWFGCLPPFLMKPCMMVSRIIRDHDDLSVRAQAYSPEPAQEGKAGLSVKTIRFAHIEQLSVAHPYCTKVPDTLSRRMMQLYGVHYIQRNPHPASRTMLLEVNLVHCPKINRFTSCQSTEFFLTVPDPRYSHGQSGVSVFEGETQAGEKAAGIAAYPGSHSICALRMRTKSCRPKDSLSGRSLPAASAKTHQCFRSASRPAAVDAQVALRQLARSIHWIQSVEPNRLQCVVHPPRVLKLDDSSFLGRRATSHAADDHIEIPQNDESHPVDQVLQFQHPVSLVASCH